jgi:hypothetical protein
VSRIELERGRRFGRWTVLRETTGTTTRRTPRRRFVVRCVCGREAIVVLDTLTTGRSKGCPSKRCQNAAREALA